MKNFTQSLLELLKHLGLNQRVSLIVAAVAVAGGLIGVMLWSQRPDYQLLYARLGEKDAAAVISYLQSQNIPHEVTAGGSAVMVPSKMVYKLRMDLAGKGLPSGEGVGFEIFDKGQFGLSDFVQRTNYLRALNNACVQAHAGRAYDLAARIADRAQPVAHENPYIYHSAACAYAAVGDYAKAFEQVKLAVEHEYDHLHKVEIDRDLGPILEWPEFKALFDDWRARQEGN